MAKGSVIVIGVAAAGVMALGAGHVHAGSAGCVTSNTGTSGNDVLCGTSGANNMSGGAGNDEMFGRDGNDTMTGSTGADFVVGESGNDIVTGGSGAFDFVAGNAGNDQLRLRDGEVDNLVIATPCGSGTDSIDLDLADVGAAGFSLFATLLGCEAISIGAVNEGPNVVISRRTPKIKDNGKVPISLTCAASLAAPCAGTLTIGSSETKVGAPKDYSINPGNKDKVSAPLSKGDRKKLAKRGKITASATSVEQGEFGDKTTVQTLELTAKD
jgi:Ca2+-binding RTX toxin-like protein